MRCSILKPNATQITQFATLMRDVDKQELTTLYPSVCIEGILKEYLNLNANLFMLYYKGNPVAFFGCAFKWMPHFWMGIPFLMTTPMIDKFKVMCVRYSHVYVNAFLNACGSLMNYVDSRNKTHLRYIRHFGFCIDTLNAIEVNRILFYPFYRVLAHPIRDRLNPKLKLDAMRLHPPNIKEVSSNV